MEKSEAQKVEFQEELAEELPEREAMSVLDVGNILGGTAGALPTDPTAGAPTADPATAGPATPLTGIAGDLAATAAEADDGAYSNSDSAVAES